MSDLWYRDAIIYGVDVDAFMDSDGDGAGDLPGLTSRLDYLHALGVTCLWILPVFPSPDRDNGYDVSDFLAVAPRVGDLGDFVELVREAHARGMRVMLDLVVEHTSDQHPWFQAARRDRRSPYRDFYIWVDEPPEHPRYQPIFPGAERSVWRWDEVAGQYYFHTFYRFQPALNHANPRVRAEVKKIMGFWLQLGVDAFRVDAASHMIEPKGSQSIPDPHAILREYRDFAARRRGDVVLLGEADVEVGHLADFFGQGNELNLLMNFLLNNYLFLALARGEAEPLVRALRLLPRSPHGQWANFLRNLDEVDLERVTAAEREEVYRAFAPRQDMRIYDRGIRRRLAPMLRGDRRQIELAFSLLFSLPGAPMLVYGDEIGMGDDLRRPERESVRTAMQWSGGRNGGYSTAPRDELAVPVVSRGPFSYRRVNVEAQRSDPTSLLSWMTRLLRLRRESPEIGSGSVRVLDTVEPSVLAHRCDLGPTSVLAVHNLGERPVSVALDLAPSELEEMVELLGPEGGAGPSGDPPRIRLEAYGYRWFRLRNRSAP